MSGRLAGLGILITRPAAAARPLAEALRGEGAKVLVFPALEIEEAGSSPGLEAALDGLPSAALAIFVSANAVQHGLARVERRGPWPPRVRVAAIGSATARALGARGFAGVIAPAAGQDTEALAGLPELQERQVSGQNVVIFRGEGGRERLREILESRGARVAYAPCYRRRRPQADPAELRAAWARGEIHVASVMSGETLENLVAIAGDETAKPMRSTLLAVPHEAIAAHPDAQRFRGVIVCPSDAEGLIRALRSLPVPP